MASGRVNALVVATRGGQVVYERFYDPLTEPEKAEVRAACDSTAGPRGGGGGVAVPDGEEVVGRFRCGGAAAAAAAAEFCSCWVLQHADGMGGCLQVRCCSRRLPDAPHSSTPPPWRSNARLVLIPSGDLLFFALGTGEYTELARERQLRVVGGKPALPSPSHASPPSPSPPTLTHHTHSGRAAAAADQHIQGDVQVCPADRHAAVPALCNHRAGGGRSVQGGEAGCWRWGACEADGWGGVQGR